MSVKKTPIPMVQAKQMCSLHTKSQNAAGRHENTTPQKKQDLIPEMPKTMSVVWLTIAFVVISVSLGVLIASLKKVPTTEMGVQYNVHKKQVRTWYCLFHCHVYIPKLKHTPFTPFSS